MPLSYLLHADSRAEKESLCSRWDTCWEGTWVLWVSAGSLQTSLGCTYSWAAIMWPVYLCLGIYNLSPASVYISKPVWLLEVAGLFMSRFPGRNISEGGRKVKKMTVPTGRRSCSRLSSFKLVAYCSVPLIPAHSSKIKHFFVCFLHQGPSCWLKLM